MRLGKATEAKVEAGFVFLELQACSSRINRCFCERQ